jgi:hypothetical protein
MALSFRFPTCRQAGLLWFLAIIPQWRFPACRQTGLFLFSKKRKNKQMNKTLFINSAH